jgi:hypothetical protein
MLEERLGFKGSFLRYPRRSVRLWSTDPAALLVIGTLAGNLLLFSRSLCLPRSRGRGNIHTRLDIMRQGRSLQS